MKIIVVLAGLVLGPQLCGLAGLLFGMAFVALTNVSCFEGACGYAAAFWMLLGMLAGLVAGPWASLRLLRRRAKAGEP